MKRKQWKAVVADEIMGKVSMNYLEDFIQGIIQAHEPTATMSIVRGTVEGEKLSAQVIPKKRLIRVLFTKDEPAVEGIPKPRI